MKQRNIAASRAGTLNLDGSYTWAMDTNILEALKLELHVDNLMDGHAIIYSRGYQTNVGSYQLLMRYIQYAVVCVAVGDRVAARA